MTRVVVTGIGATSPIGGTARATWDALLAGSCGVRSLDHEWVEKYEIPVTFAAEVAVHPDEVMERREIKRLDPNAQLALISAQA